MIKKLTIATLVATAALMANVYNLKPIKITKDIHCVIGDFNPPKKSNKGFISNICYVDMGDNIVVLDAGPTYIFAKEFSQLIKKEYPKKKISAVIFSNYHDDRTQGGSYFKEQNIEIIGYKNINEDIKNNSEKFQRYSRIVDKKLLKGTKTTFATKLVDNGYKIKGSKKTLIIIKGSKVSEEKSDIIIYSPDDSFVFAGNIVFNGRMLNYTKNSNIDGWIQALKKIKSLNAKYILGGHGKEYDSSSYKDSLEYLKILKHNVKKAYENDIDREEVKINLKNSGYKKKKIPYLKQLNKNNINNYYDQLEWAE